MAVDLAELVAPGHTALVTVEVQRGVVGDGSPLPALAAAAKPILPVIGALARAARQAGVPVLHCTAVRRPDGLGANANARIFRAMERSPAPLHPGSEAAALMDEVGAADSDLVLSRFHGLSPFQGTELDFLLRNLGVRTVVGVGVSVNVAIQSLAFDAVNASYRVVIPRDAVAGTPAEYVEAVLEHTLRVVATLPAAAEVMAAWRGPRR